MIITITTVGYGDIYPITMQGKLISVCAMIFGIIYTAMPLAIVGSYFFDAYDKQKKAMASPDDMAKSVRTKIPSKYMQCYVVGVVSLFFMLTDNIVYNFNFQNIVNLPLKII